jgi:iron(III) transport system permease protein
VNAPRVSLPRASGWRLAVSPPVAVVAALAAALVAVPIVYLLVRATEGSGRWSALVEPALLALAARSAGLALTVGAIATAVALGLAVLVAAVDLPLRRLSSVLIVLPLAIPSYVAAAAYVAGLSPRGPFGPALAWLGLGPVFPSGFGWSVLVLVTSTVPLAFVPLRAALARADGDLYDAARTLGCGRRAALIVALRPVLARATTGGFVVVVLYTLAELGTVALLRYDALPRVIYQQYLSAFDRASAARSALVLVALVIAVVAIAGHRDGRTRLGDRPRALRLRLGRARHLALAPIALYALIATALPVAGLVGWLAVAPAAGALGRALVGSLQAAAVVVVPGLIAAIAVALVAERTRRGAALARAVDVGFALPGLVVALGLAVAVLRTAPALYQGWTPYAAAMMILFVPLAANAVRASLATMPASIEEAARTLGATPRQVFWRVTWPLVRPGVLAGAALLVIATMKELGASLLLLPTGTTTLARQLWDASEEARYGEAAAPALALIALAGIAAFAVERRGEVA